MSFRLPVTTKHTIINPGHRELKELARKRNQTTVYGSASFVTSVRNRSAKNTFIVEDGIALGVDQQGFPAGDASRIARKVHEYLKGQEVIRLDRRMGLHPDFSLHCNPK